MDFSPAWSVVWFYKRLFGWRWRRTCCIRTFDSVGLATKKRPSNCFACDIALDGRIGNSVPAQRCCRLATNTVGDGGRGCWWGRWGAFVIQT